MQISPHSCTGTNACIQFSKTVRTYLSVQVWDIMGMGINAVEPRLRSEGLGRLE